MSSATSTDHSTFQPWHFFVLAGLMGATVSVLMARDAAPSNLILVSLTIFAAAFAGVAMYRTLWPLAVPDVNEGSEPLGQRTRATLEREKALVLRSIKELEFDRAMGKLSEQDFQEMSSRLRLRAVSLIKELDQGPAGYRELIEKELQARVRRAGRATPPAAVKEQRVESAAAAAADLQPQDAGSVDEVAAPQDVARCAACGMRNDADARYCKSCGGRLS